MPETTTDATVAYADIPSKPREVLDEIGNTAYAEEWWNDRNRTYFGGLRPRDVWRQPNKAGETRIMAVLNSIADGNF